MNTTTTPNQPTLHLAGCIAEASFCDALGQAVLTPYDTYAWDLFESIETALVDAWYGRGFAAHWDAATAEVDLYGPDAYVSEFEGAF